jgi:hypothetical protein
MKTINELFGVRFSRLADAGAPHLKRLCAEDYNEVLADAILDAWEHRAEYDETKEQIQIWFAGFVQRARWRLRKRGQRETGRESSIERLDGLLAGNDVEHAIECGQVAAQLEAEMTADERSAADLLLSGQSVRQVSAATGMNRGKVRGIAKRLRRLNDIRPATDTPVSGARKRKTDSDDSMRKPAKIDHDIEKLLDGPKTEKADCPVCWRCCYFDGLMPVRYRASRHFEPEIRAAVFATEQRKIAIANDRLDGFEEREVAKGMRMVRTRQRYRSIVHLFPYADAAVA